MKLKQVTIAIENSPGRLYDVTRALGDAGINIRAMNLVDTGLFGQLRILVSDVTKTRRVLMENHMPAQVNEVVAVEIVDKPGSLASILKHLLEVNINVLYTYAFVSTASGKAVMIFRFSDNDKAIEILKKENISILDAKAFGILESGV
jgi:hypothetical protein